MISREWNQQDVPQEMWIIGCEMKYGDYVRDEKYIILSVLFVYRRILG